MTTYQVTDLAGRVIRPGDDVLSFRGEVFRFAHVSRGVEYNGTAKVVVSDPSAIPGTPFATREFYADVFDLAVVTVSP